MQRMRITGPVLKKNRKKNGQLILQKPKHCHSTFILIMWCCYEIDFPWVQTQGTFLIYVNTNFVTNSKFKNSAKLIVFPVNGVLIIYLNMERIHFDPYHYIKINANILEIRLKDYLHDLGVGRGFWNRMH